MKDFWKSWGNLLVLAANIVLVAIAVQMRSEMRDYVRTELRGYVTNGEFLDSWKAHSAWAEAQLKTQENQFAFIQRQLEESKSDKRRIEDKLDRLIEKTK